MLLNLNVINIIYYLLKTNNLNLNNYFLINGNCFIINC